MDDHSSCETGRVLSAVMRVIPGCTIKIRKELIGHARSRSNRALVNSRNAIVPRSSLLQKPVPVERSTILGARDVITYVDGDGITPIGFDSWTGECTVNKQGASIHSIGRDNTTGDIEIVRGTLAACRGLSEYKPNDLIRSSPTTVEICVVRIVIFDRIRTP